MADEVTERDTALLLDMLLAARDAKRFAADMDEEAFMASDLHQSAVIRCLTIIGEAAGKVSDSTRVGHGEIQWRDVANMRHRLVHGYADVKLDVVWAVVDGELPKLIAALLPLIPSEEPS